MIYYIGQRQLFKSNSFENATIKQCLEYFADHSTVECDTETTGRNPIYDKLITLQLGDAYNQFVIDLRCVNLLSFKGLLESKTMLGQNFKFDYLFLKKAGVKVTKIYDIMIAEMVSYCGYESHGYGLASMADRYLGVTLDKSIREDFSTIGDAPFTDLQIKYMADDVTYLGKIADAQRGRIKTYKLERVVRLENRAIIPLAEIEYNGMYLNQTKWLDYEADAVQEIKQIELALDEELNGMTQKYYGKHYYTNHKTRAGKIIRELTPFQGAGLFNDIEYDRTTGVNWNSDLQVKKILKEEFDFEAIDKDGKVSLNSTVLGKIREKPPIVNTLIKYAEKMKEVSTYGRNFIKQYVQPDGRFRTSFWQIKDTGRVSSGNKASGNPNTQNIPSKHRSFIEGQGNNYLLILDYSQQEPRLTADYCQDPALLDFVLNGDGDSHSLVASAVFSKILGEEIKVSKKNNPYDERFKMTYRDVGKQINLGLDYGKTAFSIKDDLGVSQEEAQTFIDALKEAFPGKEKFFDKKKQEFWKLGYILQEYVLGRKTFVEQYPDLRSFKYDSASKEERKWYFKAKGSVERNAINYPIQGSAASMTKLAMIFCQEQIDESFPDIMMVNSVHDEIVFEGLKERLELFAPVAVECMKRAGEFFCKTIPMKIEPVICKEWIKE